MSCSVSYTLYICVRIVSTVGAIGHVPSGTVPNSTVPLGAAQLQQQLYLHLSLYMSSCTIHALLSVSVYLNL